LVLPAVDEWSQGKEFAFGVAVVVVILLSYLLGRRLALGER
jgi:hypothetical protein